MQLLLANTTDPGDIHPDLATYIGSMMNHCPYLASSVQRGLTTWCAVRAGPDDAAELLALLVQAAEAVRRGRRVAGLLVCRNIAVLGPTDVPSARAVLDWPHWITRKLYAPVQVMVGKFWIGEREVDRRQVPIAAPPVSYFSVRPSVVDKDGKFLANLPGVAAQLAASHDDGRDVLLPLLGVALCPQAVRDRYAELKSLFPAERKVRS